MNVEKTELEEKTGVATGASMSARRLSVLEVTFGIEHEI